MSSTGCDADPLSVELPERVFARNCYPRHSVRINSYCKVRYLIDILHVLNGTVELETLLASPLGSLFSLPVRRCSMSGQLVHQMLCRQLYTENPDELWFVFGGHPIRFSLMEFHEVTGLCCSAFPPHEELASVTSHADGSSPYWYKLIGGQLGDATVEELVIRLKNESNMPVWRKFRLALVVIVEGILLCRAQFPKPSVEVVEMVKNVDFFLKYPWGRHSFQRLIRTIKVGEYIKSKFELRSKLMQSSFVLHGFPLVIQLVAFKCIPSLLPYLPHAEDESTFLDRVITHLPKCKSYHVSNIFDVENDRHLHVSYPEKVSSTFSSPSHDDPKVRRLESLIEAGYNFSNFFWTGGDASLPPLQTSRKGKDVLSDSDSSSYDGDAGGIKKNCTLKGKGAVNDGDVDKFVKKKIKRFKKSLLVEVRNLVGSTPMPAGKDKQCNSRSKVSSAVKSGAVRVTRSGCAGLSGSAKSQHSSGQNEHSTTATRRQSFLGPTPVSGGGSQHSESVVKTCPEIGNIFIGAQDSHPSGSADNCDGFKDFSSSSRVASRRSVKSLPREKMSFLAEVAKGCTSNGRLFSQTLGEPSFVPFVKPSSPKSSTTDGVFPGQLFNCEPGSNMGFTLLDPIPEAVCSVRSNNGPPHMSFEPESSAKSEFEVKKRRSKKQESMAHDVKSMDPPAKNLRSRKQESVADRVKDMEPIRKKLRSNKHSAPIDVKNVNAPAQNLRSKKQSTAADVKDGSPDILSSLDKKIDSTTISKFFEKLQKFRGREYYLDGTPFSRSFFSELSKPQHWVSSVHIDLMIAFVWKKHGVFLANQRITIVDSMFTSIIGNKYMSFKQSVNTEEFVWNPLLIQYVRGDIAGRSSKIHWIQDADFVYMPMNWGKKHWVALAIDLCEGHIDILDPFEDCTSYRKVYSVMSPFAQMLPKLLRSVCGDISSKWPATEFSFGRLSGVSQNIRGGDCGALCVKLMELHSHGLIEALGAITDEQVDNVRMRYSIELYEEYVGKI